MNKKVTEITGYHLAILCHKFRNRGRRFMLSLTGQEEFDLPITVSVFYALDKDKEYLEEGANYWLCPEYKRLKVDYYKIPEARIMERSVHYSGLPKQNGLSHVVYTDCDLWFPPFFWRDYTEALQEREPGYWSAYVKDIDYPDAEKLVYGCSTIELDDINKVAKGWRHDSGGGGVGHFQCVPVEMAYYPYKAGFKSVAVMDEKFFRQCFNVKHGVFKQERRISSTPAYHFGHPHCWSGTKLIL